MVKEIRISSIDEIVSLLAEQNSRPDLGRFRSSYVFRGMSKTTYRLETSLFRNCKHLAATLEPAILRNFAKYAISEDPALADSIWRQNARAQAVAISGDVPNTR